MGISRSRKLELSKMKAFLCFTTVLAAASAAPQLLVGGHGLAHHGVAHAVGGQTTHQSVSTAHGEQRSLVQSKAFGATHSSVAQADNSKGLSEIRPSIAANRPVPVGHAAVVPLAAHVAHPVAHHAVAHAAPVVAHAAPVVGDLAEVSPYTYNYGVADDYSKAAFQQSESNDGTGVVTGSYSVNLPDGRIQTVTYNANDLTGNVAEVTYSGEAQYPPAPAGGYVAAAPVHAVHAVHAAPVVHAVHAAPLVHAVAHPVAHHVGHGVV